MNIMMDIDISKNDYLSKRNLFYEKLFENIDIKILKSSTNKNLLFKIIVCNNTNLVDVFINNCILFYLDNIHDVFKSFIGLDFEFNNGKIALNQIGLYYDKYYMIYIIDPQLLSDRQMNLYIDTILTSPIHKIVHGSDSLDVPYLFEQVFKKDISKITKFTNEMIDTRYLCEYYKIITDSSDRKCSIYDALLYFETINQDLYNYLNKMMDSIHYNRTDEWNIHKLSENHLQYTAYDVIFLKDFLNDIIIRAPKSIEIIPSMTRFIYFIKWKIYDIYACPTLDCTYDDIKRINDNTNNNFIVNKRKKLTLLNIYNKYIKTFYVEEEGDITYLLSINYFKSVITNILKYIFYGALAKNYDIYVAIDIFSENKFYVNNVLASINKLNIKKVLLFFEKFNEKINKIILSI
jgi:hypothetical protein